MMKLHGGFVVMVLVSLALAARFPPHSRGKPKRLAPATLMEAAPSR
jgi:hypothetical protein